jgi:hypothetical protein
VGFQPNQNLYGIAIGSTNGQGPSYPHYDVRAPAATDVNYFVGQEWVWPGNGVWFLLNLSSVGGTLSATWVQSVSSTGAILAIAGTTNQITATTSAGTTTLALANPLVTPGPATVTGNLTISGAGTGIVTTPTVVAAGASPQTANGRVVVVTFSGVSIAAGATQSFTITNSAITGSTTDVQYTMVGATSGSALSIQSVTNSAGSSVIVVTNGTGASTTTANITFTGIVLN